MRKFLRLVPDFRKNDMSNEVINRSFIKMTTAKGNALYAFIFMLAFMFFYNFFIYATSLINDIYIRNTRYFLPLFGILTAAYFLRVIGTEYPIYKSSSLSGMFKDLFFSWETLYLTVPLVAGIIYQCILYGGNTSFSVGNLCIFIILMFFEGRIEEYCYRGMFAEALLMRYRESSKGILGAIVMNGIVSGCISMAVYVFLYKFEGDKKCKKIT